MDQKLRTERRKLADLKAAEYNPRKALTPDDAEYQKIRRSIEEFGYVDPIIVNEDGTIIGGHQRATVLTDLGYEEVDVVVVDLDKQREKALNIALNKITGEWDELKLKDLLLDLDLGDYDISLTGFEQNDLTELVDKLAIEPEAVDDDFNEDEALEQAESEPVTKLGDVWILGRHRLMCGDSTSQDDMAVLMNGEIADLVVTDPPYNVNYGDKAEIAAKAGAVATKALGAAFNFLTSPIGLVILAIGAVIAIGVLLYKNWDTVKEKAAQLGEWVSAKFSALKESVCNAIDGFKDKFPVAFEFIKGVFDGWWTTIKGIIDGVKQTFQGIIDFVAGVFTGDWSRALDGLKNIFLGAFNALKSLALAPLNALKGVVTGAFNAIDTATGGKLTAIKEKASECWNNVKQTAGTVLQAAKDTVSEKLNNMKSAYEQHGGGIKGVAAAAIEGVKGYYTAGYTFIDNLTGGKLSAIKDKFTSKMGEVKASVSEAFNNVKDTAGNLMETARANVGAKLDAMKSAYDSAGGGIKGVVAGAMAGVQSTFSSVMSTVDTLTGGKLSSITSAFTNKLNAAKTAVTNVLGNIKQAFSDKLEAAKSVVTGALDKIKGAFNFKWSLPHLNLPHISVSGGQAPYGIAGKGSLPKFSIEWYKNGGIMTQPTAFGINPESGNLMAGGEAGPEAIVPLSQLWEKMTTILKGILAESQSGGAGNALSALVDKVGAAMQGSTQTPISGLLDRLSGGGNEPQPATANGAPITYAPVYNFNGAAPTKDDLVEAERMSQAEFNEMMEQWQRDNDRKKF